MTAWPNAARNAADGDVRVPELPARRLQPPDGGGGRRRTELPERPIGAEHAAAPGRAVASSALASFQPHAAPSRLASLSRRAGTVPAVTDNTVSPSAMLALQRCSGNRAVLRWLQDAGRATPRGSLQRAQPTTTTAAAAAADDIEARTARSSPDYVDNAASLVKLLPEPGGLTEVLNPKFAAILVEFEDGGAMNVPIDKHHLLDPKAPN